MTMEVKFLYININVNMFFNYNVFKCWLFDKGLTLLLPYILSTRGNWSSCKLRVFTIANKKDQLEFEQRR